MRRLSLTELEQEWSQFESVLDQTTGIDHWCSGLDWVLPVHQGFGAAAEPLVFASDTPEWPGYALLARYRLDDGRTMVAGLEPLWGFASPLVSAHVEELAAEVADELASWSWDHLVLPGLPALTDGHSFTARVAGPLTSLGRVGLADGIVRQVADLADGYEPWLARRSSRFRRNLHQSARRAGEAGLCFVDVSAEADVFARLAAIEHRSWKGREESGITGPEMAATYRTMINRLQPRGRLRAVVARLDATDVGYILGGVRAGIYRGLQLSYVQSAAGLSVGHLLQHHQLRVLCANGEATVYDLGMDLEYKQRWADRPVPTFTLVVERSRPGRPRRRLAE